MFNDILTVLRKELKEMTFPDGRFQGGTRSVLLLAGIGGLLFPLTTGPRWFTSWTTVFSACFPAMILLNYTTDAFAGERERHTLETLLASRLPDRAILIGKILAIVTYGWGVVLVGQPIALVALNVANRGDHFLFFDPRILAAVVGISFVLAVLVSTAGVLISMTAPTVRVAAQRMIVPFMLVFVLPSFIPMISRHLPPMPGASSIGPGAAFLVAGILGLAVAAVLFVVALHRFRRERLVLA
jgi:ABC-2 type transport system permease protein